MASTISELLVKISPEGVDETTEALGEQSDQFEETADTAEEQSGKLEEFSNRWEGAMGAFVTGLAVAAGGLLSTVPVLGEVFAGMRSIITAVAFSMDSVLRPVLSPLSDAMFQLSNAIFALEGPANTLLGVVSSIAAAFAIAVPVVAAVGAKLGAFASVTAGITSILGSLWGAITTVVGAIVGLVAAIGAAPVLIAAALVAVVAAVILFRKEIFAALSAVATRLIEWAGRAVQILTKFLGNLRTWVVNVATAFYNAVRRGADRFMAGLRRFVSRAVTGTRNVVRRVTSVLSRLATEGYNAGRGLVSGVVDGIRSRLSAVRSAAADIAQAARDRLPFSPAKTGPLSDLDKTGPALVETMASGMEDSRPRMESAASTVAGAATADASGGGGMGGRGGAGGSAQLERLIAAMQSQRQSVELSLDGRTVASSLEPLLGEGAVNAGATRVNR